MALDGGIGCAARVRRGLGTTKRDSLGTSKRSGDSGSRRKLHGPVSVNWAGEMALGETNSLLSHFGKLVAQLESVTASVPQQPLGAHLNFHLLSELVSAIKEESKETIIHWQRKCEEALLSLLVKGPLQSVGHVESLAMARVIEKGNNICIFSRVSNFQG